MGEGKGMCELMLEGEGERKVSLPCTKERTREVRWARAGARERETNNRPASQIPTSQLPTREGRGKDMCGQGHR